MNTQRAMIVALSIVVLMTTGCKDSPTSPGIEPEIVNNADSFEYQVSEIANYSGSATYMWQNTGTSANLNLSSASSAGEGILIVLDASGAQVFSRALVDNGTFVTATGVSGEWTVRVAYTSFSGTVNFRAEKST